MDYGSAFSYALQDKDWLKKLAIAAVLVLTGIGMIPVLGWMMEITRRTIRQDPQLLPEWSDFGRLIVDGLKLMAGALIWLLPYILLSACLGGITAVIGGQASSQSGVQNVGLFLNVCLGVVALPYFIIFGLLLPGMEGILADTNSFGLAINPLNAVKLVRANFGGYLISWLGAMVISMLAFIVGTIVCVIGIYPAAAYSNAVIGNLYGQAYRVAREKDANINFAAST
jgi:hypothetical protein